MMSYGIEGITDEEYRNAAAILRIDDPQVGNPVWIKGCVSGKRAERSRIAERLRLWGFDGLAHRIEQGHHEHPATEPDPNFIPSNPGDGIAPMGADSDKPNSLPPGCTGPFECKPGHWNVKDSSGQDYIWGESSSHEAVLKARDKYARAHGTEALEPASARGLDLVNAQIEKSRAVLSSEGYCGDGHLPQLIKRALKETVENTRKEWDEAKRESDAAWSECWRAMPGDTEEGTLSNAIRTLVKQVEGQNRKGEPLADAYSETFGCEAPWTKKGNFSNASDEYIKLVDAVQGIIRRSGNDLISGNTRSVAGLIMANLVHKYGMIPGKSDSKHETS